MLNLLSNEVKTYISTRPWPKGLVFDVLEKIDPAPHLMFMFYRDNWLTLDSDQQRMTATIVGEVMTKLRQDGIPTYMGRIAHAPTG